MEIIVKISLTHRFVNPFQIKFHTLNLLYEFAMYQLKCIAFQIDHLKKPFNHGDSCTYILIIVL